MQQVRGGGRAVTGGSSMNLAQVLQEQLNKLTFSPTTRPKVCIIHFLVIDIYIIFSYSLYFILIKNIFLFFELI